MCIRDSITRAHQDLQFLLDEKGAWVVAVAEVIGENGHDGDVQTGMRRFVFDRPFLVAIKEPDSTAPFLIAWIGNSALMTRL